MALPDYTTQDATTYKTNIDATAQDHEDRIATNETEVDGRVKRWGMGLDPDDGAVVVGTLTNGAIVTSTNTDGSANYPSNGQVWTYNGVDFGRTFSIHKQNSGGKNVYIQTYANDGTPQGWLLLPNIKTTGGGSNVAGGGTVGTDADTARALYTWCDVNTPQTDVFYLISAIVNGDTGNLENQFAIGGSGGIYKRDSTDDGATWSEWVKLANVTTIPLESEAITTTKTDAVLSGGAETTKNGTVVFINVNVECETLAHDETIFSIDPTHAPAVDIWLPILTRNPSDSQNHIGGTIKLGTDGNGIYWGPSVSSSALYFGINGLQWKFA